MPVAYDFASAYSFESVLKQACQKLQDFMALRGRLAQSDLGYQVNGQPQGWVGTEYAIWAQQFATSQNCLNNFLYQLNGHVVNVNNTLHDMELKIYRRSARTELPAPGLPPSPVMAPPNTVNDGSQGATPSYLYDYSDQTTGSNDQIRPFYWSILPDSADASPTDGSRGTVGGLYSTRNLAQDISTFLRQKVLILDARVRIVAEAFELADSNPPSAPPGHGQIPSGGDPQADHFIPVSTAAILDAAIQQVVDAQKAAADANAGRNAAHAFTAGGDNVTPELLNDLASHQNDPAWTSAFFNSLSEKDITLLINQLFRIVSYRQYIQILAQAYATALGSDQLQLTPAAVSALIDVVLDDGAGVPDFNKYLFQDLKQYPRAAADFIDNATDSQLLQLLKGQYSLSGSASDSDREAQFIDMAANVLQFNFAGNPGGAQDFYNRLSGLIMQTQPQDANTVLPAARQFFTAYVFASTPPPPPGAGPDALTAWAKQISGTLGQELGKWQAWIGNFDSVNVGDQQRRQLIEAVAVGMVMSAAIAAILALDPVTDVTLATVATTAGVAAVESAGESAVGVGVNYIDSQVSPPPGNPVTDDRAMGQAIQGATNFIAVYDAIAAGDVVGPGPDGNVVDINDSTNISAVLNDPGNYYLRGTDKTVDEDLLGPIGKNFSYIPGK